MTSRSEVPHNHVCASHIFPPNEVENYVNEGLNGFNEVPDGSKRFKALKMGVQESSKVVLRAIKKYDGCTLIILQNVLKEKASLIKLM